MKFNFKFAISSLLLISASSSFAADKLVIAHRGASGYLPEHTLPAKAMAYAQGVDYIEQDLVMTKDNHLVVLHDHYLDRVSNVADIFPNRARADGRFYAIDFTLDEMRTLKLFEAFDIKDNQKIAVYPGRFPLGKSTFGIHTFEEEIELIQGLNKSTGHDIGIYPEIKAPWFHEQEGKDIATAALTVLKEYGYTTKESKVYLQSFDPAALIKIKNDLLPKMGMNVKLVQLIAHTDWNETQEKQADGNWKNYSYDWMFEKGAMAEIAKYADGVGPHFNMIIKNESKQDEILLTDLVKEAHSNNLQVHPFTVRFDLLPEYASTGESLLSNLLIDAQVDGVFTDFPDKAVIFVEQMNQ